MSHFNYDAMVNSRWPWPLPPLGREEARRAAARLVRHFGKRELAGGHCDVPWSLTRRNKARTVWTSARPTMNHCRGWARLVHDISHLVFTYRHPTFRPHDGGHAQLEAEIQDYVLTKGWLAGTLKPPQPKRLTTDQKRSNKLARCEQSLKRWDAKLRRAQNAVRKLRARQKVLTAVLQRGTVADDPGHCGLLQEPVLQSTAGADNGK